MAFWCGFALYQYWVYAFFFEGWMYAGTALGQDVTGVVRTCSLVVLGATLLAIGLVSAVARRMRGCAWPLAAQLALTVCVPLAAASTLANPIGVACVAVSAALQGVGTGVLAVAWVRAMACLEPRSVFAGMVAVVIVDIGLFAASHTSPLVAWMLLAAVPVGSYALSLRACGTAKAQLAGSQGEGSTARATGVLDRGALEAARRPLLTFTALWVVVGVMFGLLTALTVRFSDAKGVFPWVVLFAAILFVALVLTVAGRRREEGARGVPARLAVPLVALVVLQVLAAVVPHVGAGSEGSGLGALPAAHDLCAFASVVLIELFTLALFAEFARKAALPVDTVFACGGAGRSLGASLGSAVGIAVGGMLADAMGDGVVTVALVLIAQIVVAFSIKLSDVPLRETSREVQRWESPIGQRCRSLARMYRLTPREEEVMELLCKGRSIERVQVELGIAKGTATAHAHHVYQKLGIHSRQELLDMVDGRVG